MTLVVAPFNQSLINKYHMNKITKTVCNALINGKKKTVSNTASNGEDIKLFGHRIIVKNKFNTYFNLQGDVSPKNRPTTTTRERLNGYLHLIGARFSFGQKNFEPVLRGLNDNGERVERSVSDNHWHSYKELKEIINS
jgi:hypothetical protein